MASSCADVGDFRVARHNVCHVGKRVKDQWTPDLLKTHFDERLNRLTEELIRELDGFPQSYASRNDLETLRQLLESVRQDHVTRREIEEMKNAAQSGDERVRTRLDEATGRRAAGVLAVSVLATVFAVLFGIILNNQITHADITQQINTEAPWLADKPGVEARLDTLEKQNESLKLRLAHEEDLSRFFCRTRTPQLPGC